MDRSRRDGEGGAWAERTAMDGVVPVSDDESLVQRALRDPEAFGVLYRQYVGAVYAYVRRHVGIDDRAQDIVAEVFTAALAGLGRFRGGPGGFRAWLFGIARHKVTDAYRVGSAEGVLPQDVVGDAGPDVQLSSESEHQQLSRLLDGLSNWEREALLMHFWDDLSWREVAAVLGKSEGAVKVAMHRRMKKLRQSFSEEDQG